MALMERVGTLLRANLNDLVDRAEDPEKMLKQVILDMENQLLQVKTQVAISLADLHLLERRRDENTKKGEEWMHKAELAVAKQLDDLARAAIERSLEFGKLAGSFVEQIGDQKVSGRQPEIGAAQARRQAWRRPREDRSAARQTPAGQSRETRRGRACGLRRAIRVLRVGPHGPESRSFRSRRPGKRGTAQRKRRQRGRPFCRARKTAGSGAPAGGS